MTDMPAPETPQRPRDRVSISRSGPDSGLETMAAHYVRQSFRPHAHGEYLLGVIEAGVHAVWCRGVSNLAGAGTVVTMNPGDVHHGGAGDARGWSQRMIYVPEAALAGSLADAADRDSAPLPLFRTAFHPLPELAARLVHHHAVLHAAPLTLARDVAREAFLRTLTTTLAPALVVPERGRAPAGRIRDAVDFLDANAREDVSLDTLSALAGLRRRQTIAAFKRLTGLPPHAYHVMRKIETVKALLRAGLPPAEAAADAGFADQSHMSRHFVAQVGITPAAYARG